MNPVVGIDVSKGGSQAKAFISKGKPYGQAIYFYHTKDGLEQFHRFLEQIEKNCGTRPDVILEATGHYHLPVTDFLEEHQYVVIVINPLISQRARSSSLRKVKTDASDAHHLAELYYKEDFEPLRQRSVQITNLRQVTRINEAITAMYVQTKLNLHAIIDQVFPLFVGVFHDMYCYTSLKLLQEFSTPQSVMNAGVDCIAEKILTLTSHFKSLSWAKEKAEKMMTAAQNCPKQNVYEGHLFSMHTLIELLLQYQGHLEQLDKQIHTIAKEIAEYDLLRSIPGIGDKLAATILSEIGDIERFDNAKKLVAFAGIDPSVFESGQFTATRNRITKRGSKRLRRALFIAIQCGIRGKAKNQRIREYYDKKRQEGKAHKTATIACMNKLLHIIFVILKKGERYRQEVA